MIVIDANILLYAYDRSSPRHVPASRWLQATIDGADDVGLALVTVLAFIRLTTPGFRSWSVNVYLWHAGRVRAG